MFHSEQLHRKPTGRWSAISLTSVKAVVESFSVKIKSIIDATAPTQTQTISGKTNVSWINQYK